MAHRAARVGSWATAGATCVAVLLAGCSSGTTTDTAAAAATTTATATTTPSPEGTTPSATDIVAKARANATGAKSGRVKATGDDNGVAVTIDSAGALDGSSAVGTITRGDAKAEYVSVGGKAYLRGNEAYWASAGAPAAQAKTLGSTTKWYQLPADKAKSLIEVATIVGIVKELSKNTGAITDSNTKLTSHSVGGVDAWVLTEPGTSGVSFAVAKDTLLPIRLEAGAEGLFVFDQWNAVPAPTAPAASEIYTP